MAVPCDVLIPAALGGMIREDNADRMECRMVVEGANSPRPPRPIGSSARRHRRDPRRDGDAGGVVVSYFEWVQNLQHFRWEEREVNDKLGTIVRRAYREV